MTKEFIKLVPKARKCSKLLKASCNATAILNNVPFYADADYEAGSFKMNIRKDLSIDSPKPKSSSFPKFEGAKVRSDRDGFSCIIYFR